jgi:two-component system cell cycle response regulator
MDEKYKKTVRHEIKNAAKDTDAPAKQDACLIVLAGGTVGMLHILPDAGEIYIGRTADAGIQIDDDGVSRKHARILITPEHEVVIHDLESTNGTYVNGVKIAEQALRNGDKLQIGPQVILKFQYQDALEEDFQRKLFESAVKDGLTGIYNKKYFLDRIETDFSYAKRHKTTLTLIIFDIDHFKKINDQYGHSTGDYVLKELAALVKRTIRGEDILARFGGEEFVVLMRDVDEAKASMLAERLRRLIEQAVFELEGQRMPVTISLGIGTLNADQSPPIETPTDLVNCADQYLYKAKRGGRNRVASKATEG